jgi:hypothetical protein
LIYCEGGGSRKQIVGREKRKKKEEEEVNCGFVVEELQQSMHLFRWNARKVGWKHGLAGGRGRRRPAPEIGDAKVTTT